MKTPEDSTQPWSDEEIERCFTYHAPTPDMLPKFQAIRDKAKELAYLIAQHVPDGKEQTIAINNIEAASMWANAGIARRTIQMGVGEPPTVEPGHPPATPPPGGWPKVTAPAK